MRGSAQRRSTTRSYLRLRLDSIAGHFQRDSLCEYFSEENRMRTSANRILATIVIVFALIAIAVGIGLSSQSIKKLSPSSPEATVQRFLEAVFDDRNDQAAALLSADSKCEAEDFDRAYIPESRRVTLTKSEITSGIARVKVSVEISNGDPFNSFFNESHTYRLTSMAGSWKIDGIPWPLYDCGNWKVNE